MGVGVIDDVGVGVKKTLGQGLPLYVSLIDKQSKQVPENKFNSTIGEFVVT